MNGSRISRLTPANARRTGNPSPSCPLGAVVTEITGREWPVVGVAIRGKVKVSAVIAGMPHSTFTTATIIPDHQNFFGLSSLNMDEVCP